MAAFEKADVKRGIAVKRGTDDVPDDGRFHVIVDGEIVYSTKVETAALLDYNERREERLKGRDVLRVESAARDAVAFRNDVLGAKATRKSKLGGRGKGGVGG